MAPHDPWAMGVSGSLNGTLATPILKGRTARWQALGVTGVPAITIEALLRKTYAAFNARDIKAVLAVMDADVDWPNGMEGGRVIGHDGVRSYWTQQWSIIDPSVTPERFVTEGDGRIAVDVHQVVRDLQGNVLVDVMIQHVYRVENGLIQSMEIRNDSQGGEYAEASSP